MSGPFKELAIELHKPVRRKFTRRHFNVFEVDETWAADLVEMQEWVEYNDGFRYILNVIDIFSKFVWSIPLKNKKGDTVLEAFKSIVSDAGNIKPKHLVVDQGGEFYNKSMDTWLKRNNINRYSTHGEHKSAVVERFNRSLKNNMWKRFTAENTRNWIDMLTTLVSTYNQTYHSTIGMSPIEARETKNYKKAVESTLSKTNTQKLNRPKLKVGDKVRISRVKATFEKGYLPNWSEEVFVVHKVKLTQPVTYLLKDTGGELLHGGFYEDELQKTTSQELHRIEKVIKKKTIKGVDYVLVKWVGYSDKFNQWIPANGLQKL